MTVQAQILDLIDRLKEEFDAAVVMITHDLGVVAEHCDDIMVMYAGKAVEYGEARDIYYNSHHPYTWGLLQSIPRLNRPRNEPLIPIPGLPPSLISPPSGCSFHPRCPYVRERHRRVEPQLEPVPGDPGHEVACLLPSEIRKQIWAELRSGAEPEQARAAVKLEELKEEPA